MTRVLLIEDSPVDARLVTGMLREAQVEVQQARSLAEAFEMLLPAADADVVLLDLGLPDSHGLETFRRLSTTVPDLPVVVFSGRDDVETVEQAVKLGAQDYLVKGEVSRTLLLRSIKYAIERHRTMQRTANLNSVLQAIRQVDQLIVTERDAEQLATKACRSLVDTRRYLAASIILVDPEDPDLPLTIASAGKSPGPGEGLMELQQAGNWPRCYQVARGLPGKLVTLDPKTHCRDCHAKTTHRGQAAAVLLRHADQTLGLLAVEIARRGGIDADETSLIEGVAGDIALALHSIALDRNRAQLEQSYHAVFNAVSDAIFAHDCDTGQPALVNEPAVKLFGWSAEELLRMSVGEISAGVPFTSKEALRRIHLARDEGPQLFEWRCRDKHGRVFWTEVSLRKAEIEGRARVLAVVRDIDERKAVTERFRAIFEGHSDGVLVADLHEPNGRFIMANPAICQMLGYTEVELLDLGIEDIHTDSYLRTAQRMLDDRLDGVERVANEAPIRRKDGTVLHADITTSPVMIEGRPGLIGCFRDVTERRRLQSSLAQSERLASVGLLAAGVAHEINNPLTYVLYNIDNVAKGLREIQDPRTAELARQATEALEGANRVRGIVKDLHTFARVDEERVVPVSLNAVIDGALNMAHNQIKYRARLVRDYGELPDLRANDGKLAQVFLNLVVNAAHAIEEGDVEDNTISVRTWAADQELHVEVKDTGKGIAAEDLPRLFDPFFTTKGVGVGSGLGLSICHNIVTAMGGRIEVSSTRGVGSCFLVHLPCSLEEEHASAEEVTEPADKSPRGRILLVDDEVRVARAISRLLTAEHDVVVLGSGAEAQELLVDDHGFDGVVCDLMMTSVSGMDLHGWLVERGDPLADRIIFVSGGVFTPKARSFLCKVTNPRLEKPFDPSELKRLLRTLVDKERSS